ncbi:DUF1707 domain-containing protein [Streptomyces sp. NPDC048639]|uniref:DUF1707 SHOCT-like domain-containing protein n=1 Tax=Streptomyces sp. NPDC048639 TaxID=3365581 RepID=UPI00371E31F4
MNQPEQQPVPLTKPATAPAAKPVAEGEIRASDADRDRFADILREAVAEGRLTAEEHSDRIDGVYRAKTLGELEPLVRDLPTADPRTHAPGPAHPVQDGLPVPTVNLVAVFSASVRRGRWRVGGRTNAFSCFGSVEIDLTEAVFEQQQVVINATSVFGSVEIRVPENVTLRGSGTGVFGNVEVDTQESAEPGAPVVVVSGWAVFGSIEARPKRGKRLRDLHARLRGNSHERVDGSPRKHLGH